MFNNIITFSALMSAGNPSISNQVKLESLTASSTSGRQNLLKIKVTEADMHALREYLEQRIIVIPDSDFIAWDYPEPKALEPGKYSINYLKATRGMLIEYHFDIVTIIYDEVDKKRRYQRKPLTFAYQPGYSIIAMQNGELMRADQQFISGLVDILDHSVFKPILNGLDYFKAIDWNNL
jgi:hypothetical protein